MGPWLLLPDTIGAEYSVTKEIEHAWERWILQ